STPASPTGAAFPSAPTGPGAARRGGSDLSGAEGEDLRQPLEQALVASRRERRERHVRADEVGEERLHLGLENEVGAVRRGGLDDERPMVEAREQRAVVEAELDRRLQVGRRLRTEERLQRDAEPLRPERLPGL